MATINIHVTNTIDTAELADLSPRIRELMRKGMARVAARIDADIMRAAYGHHAAPFDPMTIDGECSRVPDPAPALPRPAK